MICKLDKIEELNKIILKAHPTLEGDGWIYNLFDIYINETLIDFVKPDSNTCLVVGQEKECLIEARKKEQDYGEVYYCSNKLKNEVDAYVMVQSPSEYENKILYVRKAELDKKKSLEFRQKIEEFDRMENFPLFESIEIETLNRCNGTCSFCPINRNVDSRKFCKMSDSLFYSIIDQLSDMSYDGRVALFSNNEPFLDRRILQFSKYTAEKLPNACKILFTNGTLLTEEMFIKIIEYIDVFNIDIYYDNDIFQETPDELKKIFAKYINNKTIQEKMMIQFINRKAIRNNRGGISKNRTNIYMVQAPCLLPFIQMVVRPDGMTSLCCNDALGDFTLGDLNKESLIEAWNNKKYNDIRSIIASSRKYLEKCKVCDNYASSNTKGKDFFSKKAREEAWNSVCEQILKRGTFI